MKKQGIISIIATPHYLEQETYPIETVKQTYDMVSEIVRKSELNLHLMLGNEVHLSYKNADAALSSEINTQAGSRQLLVECDQEEAYHFLYQKLRYLIKLGCYM